MSVALYCPKCTGELVPLRRSGIVIDRCSECGGIYLDRGELEKIIAVEQRGGARWDDDDDDDFFDRDDRRSDDRHYEDRGRKRKSRKRSFLEELLDFD